jgi:hypothetical protein
MKGFELGGDSLEGERALRKIEAVGKIIGVGVAERRQVERCLDEVEDAAKSWVT